MRIPRPGLPNTPAGFIKIIENVSVYLSLASYGTNYSLYRQALTISLLMSPNCL
jgi:hypothetical protein